MAELHSLVGPSLGIWLIRSALVWAAPFAFGGAPLVHAAPSKAVRVAVYDLAATDVPPPIVQVVTEAVTEEVRKLEGVAVVSMSEIRAMLDLEAQKQLTGCSDQYASRRSPRP